jgi:hypothetical protein
MPKKLKPDVNLIMSLLPHFGLMGRPVKLHFVVKLGDNELSLQHSKVTLINKQLSTIKYEGYVNNHNLFSIINVPLGFYKLKIKNSFINYSEDLFIDDSYSDEIRDIIIPNTDFKVCNVNVRIETNIGFDSVVRFNLRSTNQVFEFPVDVSAGNDDFVGVFPLIYGEYDVSLKDYWINIIPDKPLVVNTPVDSFVFVCSPVDIISKIVFRGKDTGSLISQMLVYLYPESGGSSFEYITDSHGVINVSVPVGRYIINVDGNGLKNQVLPPYVDIDFERDVFQMEVY